MYIYDKNSNKNKTSKTQKVHGKDIQKTRRQIYFKAKEAEIIFRN